MATNTGWYAVDEVLPMGSSSVVLLVRSAACGRNLSAALLFVGLFAAYYRPVFIGRNINRSPNARNCSESYSRADHQQKSETR